MEYDRYYGRNGQPCSMSKVEMQNLIDPLQPRSFIKVLEELDIPFFEDEWLRIIENKLNRNHSLAYTMGAYIALMNLKGFCNFTFVDSRYDKTVKRYVIEVKKELEDNNGI